MADAAFTRRDLLKLAGAAGAAAVTPRGDGPGRGPGHDHAAPAREPLRALTTHEADLLDRIAALLVPSDENGPGATEAMAVRYIDRALAGALQDQREAYRVGLAALERYAARRAARRSSSSPRPARSRCSSTSRPAPPPAPTSASPAARPQFFALVRGHVMQGTFGDPYYGGNANFVGWDLVGYPGVRTYVAPAEQRLLSPPTRGADARPTTTRCSTRRSSISSRPGAIAMPTNLPGDRRRGDRPGRRRRRRGAAAGRGRPERRRPRGRHLARPARTSRPTRSATTSATGRWRCRSAIARCRRIASTPRRRPRAPAGHVMMNGVGGTTLHYWAQSWRLSAVGLQGGQRDHAPLRTIAPPGRIDRGGLAVRLRGARAVLRRRRARDRRVGPGRQRPGRDRPARQHLRGAAAAALSDAAAAQHRLSRSHDRRGPGARLAPVPRAGGDQLACATRTARRACTTASATAAAATWTPRTAPTSRTIPRAQKTGRLKVVTEAHVTKIEVDDQGRVTGVTYVTGKEEFFQPAKVVLLSTYTYENARLLLLSTSKAFPKGLANNHGQVGRHYFSHATGRVGDRALPLQPEQLVRPAGAGRRGGRLGRRQLRSRRRSTSSAAATCGCTRIAGRSAPPT